MNTFAYCANNPCIFTDPCGTCIHRWYFLGLVDCANCKKSKAKKKAQEANLHIIKEIQTYVGHIAK